MHPSHSKRARSSHRSNGARALATSAVAALMMMLTFPLSPVAAVSTTVVLAPLSQTAVVGGAAQVTVTVKTDDVPVSGAVVTFVVSGTNSTSGLRVTDAQGQASFSYQGAEAGTDTVQATVSSTPSNVVTVVWIATPAAHITLTPASINAAVGSSQTWTATVTDANGTPVPGIHVVYSVAGVNPKSATDAGATNSSGVATFSYTGTNAGSDTITAFTDVNGNLTLNSGELSETAAAHWVEPEAVSLSPTVVTTYTGTPLTLTATVTDSDGNPVQGVVVTFGITGANPGGGPATTDAAGHATFTDSGVDAGIDTVNASVSGVTDHATATIQWIDGPASLDLSASDTTPDVNTEVTVTATLTDKNEDAVAGVPVKFTITGANSGSGSATTDSDGKATFSYTGTVQEADTVEAYADFNRDNTQDSGEPDASMSINWGGVAGLALAPASQSVQIDNPASVGVTLTNPGGNVSGVSVKVAITGANASTSTVTTDSSGKATISYTGTNTGTDTITAWADLNGNGTQQTDEPSATASVTWTAVPPTTFQPAEPASPKGGCAYFPQTHHNLCAGFRAYWNTFGGLAVYGMPLTEEFVENGHTVQYFERARFEWHPGAWPERYDVLLGLLGNEVTAGRGSEAPFQATTAKGGANCTYYAATHHNLCAGFRAYWNAFGGLAVYGFPISEEFQETNPDTGQVYTVQYFQRARFEWHPGEWPSRYDVELGRLGAQILQTRYGVSFY